MDVPIVHLNMDAVVQQQYLSVGHARRAALRALRWLRSIRNHRATPPSGIRAKMELLKVGGAK